MLSKSTLLSLRFSEQNNFFLWKTKTQCYQKHETEASSESRKVIKTSSNYVSLAIHSIY